MIQEFYENKAQGSHKGQEGICAQRKEQETDIGGYCKTVERLKTGSYYLFTFGLYHNGHWRDESEKEEYEYKNTFFYATWGYAVIVVLLIIE